MRPGHEFAFDHFGRQIENFHAVVQFVFQFRQIRRNRRRVSARRLFGPRRRLMALMLSRSCVAEQEACAEEPEQ
jgi:hypothetical protein